MYRIRILLAFTLVFNDMSYAQLNEKIISQSLDEISNRDFIKTVDADYDNPDIEFECDYYYKPNIEEVYSFLGFPISTASFFLFKNQVVVGFGLQIYIKNANEFYLKMAEKYGEASIVSHSEFYLQNKGIILPKKPSPEAEKIIQSIPYPTVEEYKDVNIVSWYDIFNDSNGKEIVIRIYNNQEFGHDFGLPNRKLRIIFSYVDED